MNTPGFTAEASLYKTSERYHMRSMGSIVIDQVAPQIPPWIHCGCRGSACCCLNTLPWGQICCADVVAAPGVVICV